MKRKTKSNFIVTRSYNENIKEIQELRKGRQDGRAS